MIKEFFICILRNKVMGEKETPQKLLITSGVQHLILGYTRTSLRLVGKRMPETLGLVPVAAGKIGHFHRSTVVLDGDTAQFVQ